jgi:signal transduction histidine kinase
MLRRSLLVLPLLALAAAWLGVRLAASPAVAMLLAGAIGLAVAGALSAVAERRLSRVADRVLGFADADAGAATVEVSGSRQWRRLAGALTAVGASLRQRFAELADERARVERLLDNLPTAMLLFTTDGLAYANPAAQEMFSCDRQAHRTPLRVLGVAGLADAVTEARETDRTVEVEVQRGDRELVARASVAAAGEVALVVTDLTETRRLEEVRRDFVTNASHELKTPVAGIQALADSLILALERDPDRARTMVWRLQQEAVRLAQLVRDLLDLARLEEGLAHSGRRRVDLADVIRAQVNGVSALAEQRRVAVAYDDTGPAPVVALPEDLRLIVANLLENAVLYNRPGGEVRVRARRRGGQVELEVADNGLGVPEADRDRIFERFYRVDKARSRAAGGTGLGLAIVRHAVARHGGDVGVSSVLGEGSTFRVVLPVEGSEGR